MKYILPLFRVFNIHSGVTYAECSSEEEAQRICDIKNRWLFRSEYNYERISDRPKTPTEQHWDAMSDLQKMQLQGLLEHYSNEYITASVQSRSVLVRGVP